MSYKKFTLAKLQQQFSLSLETQNLFERIEPLTPSAWLQETLSLSRLIALNSEKAKSELIIMPILAETLKRNSEKISLHSGIMLNADSKLGLNGECDFILSNKAHSYFLESPVFALVEAKNDNINYGLAQCIAQLVGANLFNQQHNQPLDVIYGCVSTGDDWQFLKLAHNKIYLDNQRYYLDNISGLLGIFQHIVNLYSEKNI